MISSGSAEITKFSDEPQCIWGELFKDFYCQAVIHLAWFRDDRVRHLLFGMVELRPNEIPDIAGCLPKDFRPKKRGRKYLHYRRFVQPAEDAFNWYQGIAAGNPVVLPCDPDDPTRGDGEELKTSGTFIQEPPWPHFVTSNDLVFAPDWMQGSRIHFLLPPKTLSSEVSEFIRVNKNRAKLEEWLNFDIAETYSDYQGMLCLIAPNPLFRSIEKSHLDGARKGAAETVAYKLVARHGQSLAGLRLEVINERLRGRMAPLIHEFSNDPIAVLDFPAQIYNEGRSIAHPAHGLLHWQTPATLVRTIRIGMEVEQRQKKIRVPAGGRRRPEYEYEVGEVEGVEDIVASDALNDDGVVSRFAEAENRRSRLQAAKDYDQQWFYNAPSDAAEYVRQKIGDARDKVLIVDPYFAGRELMAFGHAIRRPTVQLQILTSAQGLKEMDGSDPNSDYGEQLLTFLNDTFKDYSTKPEVRVLTGNSPAIHDRFLVVDRKVWLSGNSLNTIGDRAGMIVRLPEPESVIVRLEAFWRQSPILSDWLNDRR